MYSQKWNYTASLYPKQNYNVLSANFLLLLLNLMPSDITNGHGLKQFYEIFFYNNKNYIGYTHEINSLSGWSVRRHGRLVAAAVAASAAAGPAARAAAWAAVAIAGLVVALVAGVAGAVAAPAPATRVVHILLLTKKGEFRRDGMQSHIWLMASSYMTKYSHIFFINEETLPHIWLCIRSLLNFYIKRQISPIFLQCIYELVPYYWIQSCESRRQKNSTITRPSFSSSRKPSTSSSNRVSSPRKPSTRSSNWASSPRKPSPRTSARSLDTGSMGGGGGLSRQRGTIQVGTLRWRVATNMYISMDLNGTKNLRNIRLNLFVIK